MDQLWISVVSVWSWSVLIAAIVVWFPLIVVLRLVTAPFDSGRYAVGLLFRKIAVVMAKLNPLWRFRRSGVSVPDPRRPYVVVSNHESFADILLISHLPWEMKWLSKAELFRIPIMGWMMSLVGDIPVKRGFGPSAAEAMQRCREALARRVSVMIFPEGTRSVTGEMLPFKDGAFRLAIESGVPVLPLVVSGTRTALPKHGWHFGRARAEVRVLEPVETTGLSLDDVPALKDRVRRAIVAAYAELRKSPSATLAPALPLLLASAFVFSVAACDARPDPRPEQQAAFAPGPVPAKLADGERLFNASCSRCHGNLALGTQQGPPLVHITYEPNHHADVAFQRAVLLGVQPHHWNFGPMPRIEGVTEAEVTEITTYVRWLQRTAGIF